MKRHIQTVHEGHKDYKCESCGKSFSLVGNLKKHINKIHDAIKYHKSVKFVKSHFLKQEIWKTISKGFMMKIKGITNVTFAVSCWSQLEKWTSISREFMGRKINLTINDVKSLKSSKNCHNVWYYNIRKSDFQNSIVLARWKYNIENVFQCWLCNKFFLSYYSMKKKK